jgi:hypothetical protein
VDLRYEQQVVLEMATGKAEAGAAGEPSAENADVNGATSGQVAENVQVASEKHTSGAKAPADSAGLVPGINPRPTNGSAGNVKPVKAKTKPAGKGAGKVKASAAKKANGKTRTSASAVKANAAAAKKTNAKSRKASTTDNARNKKRAAGKRTALNVSRQKTASTPRPASSAEPGQ